MEILRKKDNNSQIDLKENTERLSCLCDPKRVTWNLYQMLLLYFIKEQCDSRRRSTSFFHSHDGGLYDKDHIQRHMWWNPPLKLSHMITQGMPRALKTQGQGIPWVLNPQTPVKSQKINQWWIPHGKILRITLSNPE